jgi:inositol-phosphate phosphatase / L-galactose 1-phosphate phosphatase / histidinol-phosphatase
VGAATNDGPGSSSRPKSNCCRRNEQNSPTSPRHRLASPSSAPPKCSPPPPPPPSPPLSRAPRGSPAPPRQTLDHAARSSPSPPRPRPCSRAGARRWRRRPRWRRGEGDVATERLLEAAQRVADAAGEVLRKYFR